MKRSQNCSTKRVFSTLATLFIFSIAKGARAECYPIERAPLDADCVVMPYGDQAGVWLRLDQANALRKLKLREPELEKQIDLYAGVVASLEKAKADYQQAHSLQIEATRAMEVVNKNLVAEARIAREAQREAEAQRDAWYRSPLVWFGAGIAASLAIGVSAIQFMK